MNATAFTTYTFSKNLVKGEENTNEMAVKKYYYAGFLAGK
jgi:hypothetical protein